MTQARERSDGAVKRGTQLNGIYEIDEPLASGGMGEVFKGHAVQTGDPVAIKLIRADLAEDESVLAMFRREASALYSIHHEAIVRYFVFSVDPALQRPYLAMEYVEGEPLSDILKEGPLDLADILALKARVASGLEAAHARKIVHRDISPDNIIVPDRDFARARIIDFGIARSLNIGDATVIGGGFAGKYNYVSPEQLGLFDGDVTARSDIYSLGLILAYASIGRPIDMKGSQFEVIEKRRVVPDLSEVDPELRPLLFRMLQPDPQKRPASMLIVAAWMPVADEPTLFALPASALTQQPLAPLQPKRDAKPVGEPAARRPPPLSMSGRRWILPTGAAAVFVLVAAVATFVWLRPGPPPETKTASASTAPTLKPATTDPISGTMRKPLAFVSKADLGPCAVVVPVSISDTSAVLDAFGVDAKPFELFDRTFNQAIGFEADIALRQIAPPQCPALGFVARAVAAGLASLKIDIKSSSVRRDSVLAGKIATAKATVQLLLVDDLGRVHNATVATHPTDGGFAFAFRFPEAPEGFHPLLLLAAAGPTKLPAFDMADTGSAGDVFKAASEDLARRADTEIAVSYVAFQ